MTHERREILTTDLGRTALRTAIQTVRAAHPFRITAVVILPDHLHAVWIGAILAQLDFLDEQIAHLAEAIGGSKSPFEKARHRRGGRR